MSLNIREPRYSLKSLLIAMLLIGGTCLFVGSLGVYFGAKNTHQSSAKEVVYLQTMASDSIHGIYMDEALKIEAKATKYHASRADKAEAQLIPMRSRYDSLLRLTRIKSRPVVTKQDYINADKWVLDYNKNLKR